MGSSPVYTGLAEEENDPGTGTTLTPTQSNSSDQFYITFNGNSVSPGQNVTVFQSTNGTETSGENDFGAYRYDGYYVNDGVQDVVIDDTYGDYYVLGYSGQSPIVYTQAAYVVCFAAGALIRTVDGEKEVENLEIGDTLLTVSGQRKLIRWIGHRHVRCDAHPSPRKIWPVRVRAGAFGLGLPYADLWLSPNHALCLADTLVPVRALIDGDRVVQVEQAEVTYWHVEVEGGHDVILANGMPAESYLDTGNRRFFGDDGVVGLHFEEDPASGWDGTGTCLPLVESGPRLYAIRTLYGLGQPGAASAADAALAGVHLVATDGEIILPCVASDNELRFFISAGAADLRLASPSSYAPGDIRHLGLLVSGLAISDGSGWQEIALDHPALFAGFYDAERDGDRTWRWTDGDGHLAASLFSGHVGPVMLRVSGVFNGFEHDRDRVAA